MIRIRTNRLSLWVRKKINRLKKHEYSSDYENLPEYVYLKNTKRIHHTMLCECTKRSSFECHNNINCYNSIKWFNYDNNVKINNKGIFIKTVFVNYSYLKMFKIVNKSK